MNGVRFKFAAMIFMIFAYFSPAMASEPASTAQPKPAPSPCSEPQFRDFDFWVGEWDVYNVDGVQVGVNAITVEEKGCLLVEHWTDANGNTGQSYNFFDHATGKWRQVWVSPGVVIDYVGGLDEAGAMQLEGAITTRGTPSQKFRGTWTPQEDGSVRQHLRNFDEVKGEWAEGFVGIYVRRSTN